MERVKRFVMCSKVNKKGKRSTDHNRNHPRVLVSAAGKSMIVAISVKTSACLVHQIQHTQQYMMFLVSEIE